MNDEIVWHPRFSIAHVESRGAFFISEDDQYLLDAKEYGCLHSVIDRKQRIADYVLQSSDLVSQVERIRWIDQLLGDGVLVKADERPSSYFVPNFKGDIEQRQYAQTALYLLSDAVTAGDLEPWVASLKPDREVALVVVDDYLDPRLPGVATLLHRKGLPWVLMKPVGARPMIGPVFMPEDAQAPCYHCLFARLVHNHPIREWWRRQDGADHHHALPIYHQADWLETTLAHFGTDFCGTDAAQWSLQEGKNRLLTLDQDSRSTVEHFLLKRPQCAVCGDPEQDALSAERRFVLNDVHRMDDTDGGYRQLSRQATVDSIRPLISPVSGLISDLQQLTTVDDDEEIAIYRAAYYQNDYRGEAVTADTFVQLSLGKGVSKSQAMSSALGEALERQAAQYAESDKTLFGTPDNLPLRTVLPQELAPFSPEQYRGFERFSATSLSNPQWVREYDTAKPLHWVRGWSLTRDEEVCFPAAFCLANTPFEDQVHSLYTHNGNSAGNTREEAVLQGMFELIERDVVAIWWYNQIPRPEISLEVLPADSREKIERTLGKNWDYWLLDVSHDIDVVSCVAVARHKNNGQFVLGFGTHLQVSVACQRALTELYQLVVIKDEVTGPFDFAAIKPRPYLLPKRNTAAKTLQDYRAETRQNIKDDILQIVAMLQAVDVETCVVDYSRADLPLHTLKVIAPGLCHFWPQLANRRLYDVPVKLGWLSQPLAENQLNPIDLYL